jgi:hypothetical protein
MARRNYPEQSMARRNYPEQSIGNGALARRSVLMALAPVMLRLGSLRLSSVASGTGVVCVLGRVLNFLVFQTPSATGHGCDATDDKYHRKDAEDQDVEHGLFDHQGPVPFQMPSPGPLRPVVCDRHSRSHSRVDLLFRSCSRHVHLTPLSAVRCRSSRTSHVP